MFKILFVCMGNICRSPSAEGFFAHHLQQSVYKQQILIDSAGTHSYHLGHSPDPRAIKAAQQQGIELGQLRARKVCLDDFAEFDLIIAMDTSNYNNLQALRPVDSKANIEMMLSYHPRIDSNEVPEEVPDPYYGGADGFIYMNELLDKATAALLLDIETHLGSNQPSR